MRGRKSNPQLEFDRFPQIHNAHHHNKLYGLTELFSKASHEYCLLLLLLVLIWLESWRPKVRSESKRFPRISTVSAHEAGFLTGLKASKVRQ